MGVGEAGWRSIPFCSLFALIVLLAGIGCFTGPFFIGLTDLEELLKDENKFNLRKENEILCLLSSVCYVLRIGELRIVLVISAVVTGVIGILLVVFGALATGATRKNVYSRGANILSGRCSAIFFMVLSCKLNVIWTAITSGMAIPVIFFVMLNRICETEYTYQGVQAENGQALRCFNLTRIGVYFEGFSPNPEEKGQFWHGPALCNQQELTDMCQLVKKEIPLVSAAFAGSFLITMAMVIFVASVSANYQRIKTAKELTDYREALEQDTTEMDNIIASRRQFNSSYATESVMS